jgi:hypothetical protein
MAGGHFVFFAVLLGFVVAAGLAARLAIRDWWSFAAFLGVALVAFGRIATLPFFGDVSAYLEVPALSADDKTDIILACALFTLLAAMVVAGAVVAAGWIVWERVRR